jgi:xylulokinase
MLSLGFDLGSSSVKGTVIDVSTGAVVASASYPKEEMAILAPRPGWAEQDPHTWWDCVRHVTRELLASGRVRDIGAIGISYQMHGLVITDAAGVPLRPSIIWCDSRAVEIGNRAFQELGEAYCLSTLLNSPGNFTASKLSWVREQEPEVFRRIAHVLLPGDYIAYRMTGEATTTVTGLSEGIFWDFKAGAVSQRLLEHYRIDPKILSRVVPAVGEQGRLSRVAAEELGLREGTPVAYRAGDQPNNALSLNVFEPGEVATTAGTSGVVYGVTDRTTADPQSRVNLFAHVNHTTERPRLGILLCVNGTGILYSWLRKMFGGSASYADMNAEAANVKIGSEGILVLPFGNGAERMLENKEVGGRLLGLDLIRHGRAHLVRASQEGIAFSLRYGMGIMRAMGMSTGVIRAGRANLFLSPVFRQTLANVTGATIELYDTDGSAGAARGAAVGVGAYPDLREAFRSLKKLETVDPQGTDVPRTLEVYGRWETEIEKAGATPLKG